MWIGAAVAPRFNFQNLTLFHAGTVLQMFWDLFPQRRYLWQVIQRRMKERFLFFRLRLNFDALTLY